MSRRRWLVALGLAGAVTAALYLSVPRMTRRLLVDSIARWLGRPVHTESVHVHWFPPEIEVRGLTVAGLDADSPPSVEITRLLIVPGLSTLWERRPSVTRVRVEGARIRVRAFPEGGDDIPRPARTVAGQGVRIGRLTIAGGELLVDHERIPLDLDLPDFEGRLGLRQGALVGRVGFGLGTARFGTAPALPVRTELDLRWAGALIDIEGGQVSAEGTRVTLQGRLDLSAGPAGRVAVTGPVDLGEIDRHIVRTGFGMDGAASYDGVLTVEGSRVRLNGRLTGTDGRWDDVPVPRFDGEVAWDEDGVHISGLSVATLGGQARLDVEVPPGRGPASITADMEGVDAEGLVSALFDLGRPGLASRATGRAHLEWPRGRFQQVSGEIELDLRPGSDGRLPMGGRFEWTGVGGRQRVRTANLHTPASRAAIQGSIDHERRSDLTLDVSSTDLAETDGLLAGLRRALGRRGVQPFGMSGAASFRGRWTGRLHDPVFEGRFVGREVRYLDVAWGDAEWVGRLDSRGIDSHSLVLRKEAADLWIDGRMETGDLGTGDGLEVRTTFRSWPAEDLVKALGWNLAVVGPVSGRAEVGNRRSAPRGRVEVQGPAGTYYGVPYADLAVEALLEEDRIRVPQGTARIVPEAAASRPGGGSGRVSFTGTLTNSGEYDGTATMEDVDAGVLLAPVPGGARWAGRLSGELALKGPLERPHLEAKVSSPRLFLGDEGLGRIEARFTGDGTGAVVVAAHGRSPRLDVEVQGRVEAALPYRADLTVKASESSLDAFLRPVIGPVVPPLVASGSATLRGPLDELERLEIEAELPRFTLLLPDYPVESRRAFRFAIRDGRLFIGNLELAGEGTDLLVSGMAALFQDGPLEVTARGAADLRALAAVTRRLRGRGAAHLDLAVKGTRDAPDVDGTLALTGGGVRLRGFPHGLEGVRGRLRFTESNLTIDETSGTLGGGTVSLEGQAAYAGGRLESFDILASGRDLALRYPEGLRSRTDVDLHLFGDADQPWLAGDLRIEEATWTRRYDLASELLASEARALVEPTSLEAGVRYDIKVHAPGTLRIENNLATLDARAELQIQGTSTRPVVLGRAEVDRGRVYFQGNTYVIRRGAIDFADLQRVDPFFDIEAETQVRSYRVTLRMTGTLERVTPTLSSDPPLSAVQILNLLAGADDEAVTRLAQAQNEQGKLAATGAYTLAAGWLSEEMGLERGAERLFLNRFSIDPSAFQGDVTNPTARLVVGKRVKDVNVLYSVDLRGSDERVSVEYTLSDALSLFLTRSEPSGLGFDLRLRQSR